MGPRATTFEMKHVVALSGGKDSTAMALRLAEVEPRDYIYVCTPTGNEPTSMFAHWRKLGTLLGKPLTPITYHTGLFGLIKEQNSIPNWRARFCTRLLKIEPYAAWLAQNSPCVSYVGLRADEEEREGGDYAKVPNVQMDFPMRRWGWTIETVYEYLQHRGVTIPTRTDCKLCFYQRLIEWWELWKYDLASYLEGERIEAEMGHTFRSPGRDTWPAALSELRRRFEAGDIPRETRIDPINGMKCRVCRI
jgi:3'-phosphoadenosine 5'-phosphosulfate sulfotransferase (PAPS reductase)/FAD synthetase